MSAGLWLLAGVLAGAVVLLAVQGAVKLKASAQRGKPAPELPGALGDAVRGTALLYFFSPTCGPCRAMTPKVRELAASDGRVHLVDVSRTPEVAMAFGVMGTPTLVLVLDGKIDQTRVGAQHPAAIEALLA